MLPLDGVEHLLGRAVFLCRDASIRQIGGNHGADFAAFKGDENVTFPFRPNPQEYGFYQTLLNEGKVACIAPAETSAAARLALDGVLAVREGSRLLTGTACAASLLGQIEPHCPSDRHTLLLAGRLLRTAEAGFLAQALYTSGRWPAGPASLAAAQRTVSALNAMDCPPAWTRIPLPNSSAWIAWRRQSAFASNPTGLPRVKLYVSIPPAFFEAIRQPLFDAIFASPETHEVKTASNAPGLHRADAMVVYSETHGHLATLARSLAQLLAGAPPSGMTFAAAFPETTNLFWGIDPLLPEHLVYGESWRRFLCSRCARVASGLWEDDASDPLATARAALFRLGLDGIDTTRWIPPYANQAA